MTGVAGSDRKTPVGQRPGQGSLRYSPRGNGRYLERARRAVALLFGPAAERGFAVSYWDSGTVERPAGPAGFTLILRGPQALRRAFLPPTQLRIASAFIRGDLDVTGDLEAATRVGEQLHQRLTDPGRLLAAGAVLSGLPAEPAGLAQRPGAGARRGRRHSARRDEAAIRSHYDVGNDFYRLWLDRRMVYSCGYFPTGTEDIHQAQEAKLDLICRKLRLQPGERLLDIGCGWGGLILFAAQRYGVEALGITLSQAQADEARERIHGAGLTGRCRVELRDYRALEGETFDKVVSVGMCEHVGRKQLAAYFQAACQATRPGGLFLNHCITLGHRASGGWLSRRLWRDGSFIDRYVFPDGELPALAWLIEAAETVGFETRDAESLREHYATTLRRWGHRLEAAEPEAVRQVGRATWRTWRLYLAGSAAGFAAGRMNLIQLLLSRPDQQGVSRLPPTRADLYR